MQDKISRAVHGKAAAAWLAPRSELELQQTVAVITAAFDLYRAGAVADAILEARHGLDARCYTVLRLIGAGCRYPSQIAEEMHLPRSVITRALHTLSGKRYIARAFDREDSRRTRLALTPGGEQIYEAATRSLSEWVVPQLSGVSEAEFEGFFRTVAAFKETSPFHAPDEACIAL